LVVDDLFRRKDMRAKRIITLAIITIAGLSPLLSPSTDPAVAQGENLLVNPSFEGQYSSYTPETGQEQADCKTGLCNTAQMPAGWKPWWVKERPTDVNPEFKPAEFGGRIHSGSRAAQYFSFWSTHKAGLRQTVTVPPNSTVQFSVWGQIWMTESDSSNVSDYSGTSNMRIGIDPTGGTNPYGGSIVWSGFQTPFDAYQLFSVQAQAQGDSVTVFTYSAPDVNPNSPDYGFKHNDVYWDDASLTVVGAAAPAPPPPPPAQSSEGAAPAAPAPAVAPRSVPFPTSTPDAEGLIYSEVQPGDSFWAIAARAGLSINDLLELNEIGPDVVLRSGDLLIIGRSEPPESTAEGTEAESEGAEAAADSSQEEAALEDTEEPVSPSETGASDGQNTAGASICLKAFDDANKNAQHDDDEILRPAVAFTISDGQSVVSNYVTDGESEPFCITGLAGGNYRVTRSSLDNEVMTTPGDRSVAMTDGSLLNLEFGSYESEAILAVADTSIQGEATASNTSSKTSPNLLDADANVTSFIAVIAVVVIFVLVAALFVILRDRRATV
jgi:LysM repeat protein